MQEITQQLLKTMCAGAAKKLKKLKQHWQPQ